MKTIVIFNQKGGVGKTSTVVNLMAELKNAGKKVLAFDLDGQGNLTKFLQVSTDNKNTVRELLLKEATFQETVQQTIYGDLVPADEALQGELLRFASMPAFILSLKNIVKNLGGYDVVLMDCAPSPNQITVAALVAADYTIIPTEAEYFSADGVAKLYNTIEQVKQLNENLKVLGLLIVKYNGRRSLTAHIEKVLNDAAVYVFKSKVFDTKIRFTVDIPSSQALHLSVNDYKRNSKAAIDYKNLTKEILEDIK